MVYLSGVIWGTGGPGYTPTIRTACAPCAHRACDSPRVQAQTDAYELQLGTLDSEKDGVTAKLQSLGVQYNAL